jgi:hypothetical protein
MSVRSREQRKHDVLELLESEVDAWVSSATADGLPYLIPLAFAWNGEKIILATSERSITTANVRRTGVTRVGIGPTRDVVMIDGEVDIIGVDEDGDVAEFHTERAGFDARTGSELFVYLVVTPVRIQAWRTPAELAQRLLMNNGRWLV